MTNIPAVELVDSSSEASLLEGLATVAQSANGVDVSGTPSVLGLYARIAELEKIISDIQSELGLTPIIEPAVVEEPVVIEEPAVVEEVVVTE